MDDAPLDPRPGDMKLIPNWLRAVLWRLSLVVGFAAICLSYHSLKPFLIGTPFICQLLTVVALRWKWRTDIELTPAQQLKMAMTGLTALLTPVAFAALLSVWPDDQVSEYGRFWLRWCALVTIYSLGGVNFAAIHFLVLVRIVDWLGWDNHSYRLGGNVEVVRRHLVIGFWWLCGSIGILVVPDSAISKRVRLALLFAIFVNIGLVLRMWLMHGANLSMPQSESQSNVVLLHRRTKLPETSQQRPLQVTPGAQLADWATKTYFKLILVSVVVLCAALLI